LEWWEVLVQQTINGLTRGAVFALIALGYTMVYGIVELINFAHGDVFMLGAFLALTIITAMLAFLGNFPRTDYLLPGFPRVSDLLHVAALIGRDVDLRLLSRAAGEPERGFQCLAGGECFLGHRQRHESPPHRFCNAGMTVGIHQFDVA